MKEQFISKNLTKLLRISGIYKITSPSKKVYIGQSVHLYERLKSYFEPKSAPNQKILKYSFNKYGVENHVFEIIEECSVELLNERERYWQEQYKDILLNCRFTKHNDKSGYCSQLTKNNISKALKATDASWKHLKKKVYQFDKDNNLIAEYESVSEAARQIGVNKASICKAIKGKLNKTCKGFYWTYEEARLECLKKLIGIVKNDK